MQVVSSTIELSRSVCSRDEGVFEKISASGCNLTIWERSELKDMAQLISGDHSQVRFVTTNRKLVPKFCHALVNAEYPPSHARERLINDVSNLAALFTKCLSIAKFEVRLEIVTTNSCRKFHSDVVSARLITTYSGQGTQWLDDATLSTLRTGEEPDQIRQMRAGDVGIFKGQLSTKHPAIHRSPPIAGAGERRLLLVLNCVDEGLAFGTDRQ